NPAFAHLGNRYIEALLVTAESDPRNILRKTALDQVKVYFETTKERGADPSRVEQRLKVIAENPENKDIRHNASQAIEAFGSDVLKPATPKAKLARSLETFETL